jgi:hypothetical protein
MQIPFLNQMSDQLKLSTGCTPNAGTGVGFSEKVWSPKIYDVRWEHCASDLDTLLKLFKKAQRMNPDFYDKISSQEMGVIYTLIQNMIDNSIPAKVWFSDTAASAGGFTAGTDLGRFNVIDGLFKQIFAEVASGADNYIEISENAAASKAGQVLGADVAYDTLEKMFNAADSRLIDEPSAAFYVTRSMADNYRDTLRSKTIVNGNIDIAENGKRTLSFEGYEVKVKSEWDRTIKADQDLGATFYRPNRAVFTTPSNIPVATLSTSDLTTLDSFYDQYRK